MPAYMPCAAKRPVDPARLGSALRALRRALAWPLVVAALIVSLPGAAVSQELVEQPEPPPAMSLPPGFSEELVAEGLDAPTAFAFLPDGRILIAEQAGLVRLWKDGALLPEPFLDLRDTVNARWERGLQSIAVDPRFGENGHVYVFYAFENDPSDYRGPKTSRLSRFIATGDVASRESETVLLGTTVGASCNDYPPGTDCVPADLFSHNGGGLEFAADGTLFVGVGDAASNDDLFGNAMRVQNLDLLAGKILRITTAGQGLETNPFWTGDPASNRSKVWAYGVRNPFRLTLHPVSGLPIVGDVGERTQEELNVATAGANLGWPCYEGPQRFEGFQERQPCQELYARGPSAVRFPLLSMHRSLGHALIGGAFYTGTVYPQQYRGAYFFDDYIAGYVATLRVDEGGQLLEGPREFGREGLGLVAMRMGADGLLYYLSIWSGRLLRLTYDGVTDAGAPRQLQQTAIASAYDNGTLEGVPATTFVTAVGSIRVPFPDGDSKSMRGFHGRWSPTRPADWAQGDLFSLRVRASAHLDAGGYQFVVYADDGIRVWLDDEVLVDSWGDQPATSRMVTRDVAEGLHEIRAEYYNRGPEAIVKVGWEPAE